MRDDAAQALRVVTAAAHQTAVVGLEVAVLTNAVVVVAVTHERVRKVTLKAKGWMWINLEDHEKRSRSKVLHRRRQRRMAVRRLTGMM